MLMMTTQIFFNLSEASHNSESRIPLSINPFPAASVLFEDTDRSTYELPSTASVPVRINGINTSRVNGSSTLPSTSANDSKY